MMNGIDVTPNISILPSPGFGNPNYGTIVLFFYMVDSNMMSALELPLFSSKKCTVRHKMDNPMCSKEGDSHIIYISAHDNYWCKWVYQFAHEYCHHLIDGTLSGEWADLLWFEETICELSSIYNLYKMERFCSEVGLGYFSPSVEEYKENLLNKNAQLYNLSPSGGWYSGYASSLSEVGYKRDLYNAIAALMFPLFVENPRLWKIILHIGDIRSWNSLEDLFTHLQSKADDSYADSLNQLRRMFS